MTVTTRSLMPVLTTMFAALLALSLSCDASAATDRQQVRAEKLIAPCVAELAKHADLADAERVVHWVSDLEQKNLVEMRIRIDTDVYAGEGDEVRKQYSSTCDVSGPGKVVKFRISPG